MNTEQLHYSDIDISDEELEDTTWMEILEKEEEDYKSFYKENVDVIKIFYTYVNSENNIYYVKKDNLFVENNKINREELIYLLKKNKNNNNKNHKLISVLQYNIDLEPEDVLNYLKYKEKYNFLTIVSKISDILWNDTISIFKNLNSLHIVYYEEPTKKSSNTKKVYIRNAKLKRNKHTRKRT
tara:strand:- start:511 stop:1059 length:549 start_codon:yes stop_codon:yes gene_type:complete